MPAGAHAQLRSGAATGALYTTIQDDLQRARSAGDLQTAAARLLREPTIRDAPAVRHFVAGYAALLRYDRNAAERELRRSFQLSSSPAAALALAANAIEAGHADAALEWAERGFGRLASGSDSPLAIELRVARAQALAWLTRRDEQRAEVAQALEQARRAGDPRRLALALRAHGAILGDSGSRVEALDSLGEAVRLSEAEGDHAAAGYHLLMMSNFYYPERPFADKLAVLDRALALAQQARDRQLEGRVLGTRGASLYVLARYGEALRELTAADALLQQTGALRSRATVAGNLSLVLSDLGNFDEADQQARVAVALYRRVGNRNGARQSLDDLGRIALLQKRPSIAVSRHERVVSLTRELGDTDYLRAALVRLGLAYSAREEWQRAEHVLREALRLGEDGKYPDERESARIALADVLRATGRLPEAAEAYRHALAVAPGAAHAATLLVRAHHGLALLESRAGRPAAALTHYRTALAGIERARESAGRAELQLTYFSDKAALYVDAIDALVETYRQSGSTAALEEAFVIAERAKARTLLDALTEQAHAAAGAEMSISLNEIAAALDPSDLLIEFVVGAKRSFVFTLRRDRAISVHQLPSRAVLEQQVEAVRQLVTRRPSANAGRDSVRRVGTRAYATLLAPALARTPEVKRLILVADGVLFYTPFEALTDPASGSFVGEIFDVVRAPSASVISAIRSRARAAPTDGRFVGFGDPRVSGAPRADAELVRALERDGFSFAPLPASRREVEDAAAAFSPGDTRLYTGDSFTTQSVLAELQRRNQIVHFATHAILDERVPDRSGILVSATAGTPVIVRARDLNGLKIPVDLVVLSACQTGLGRIVAGEGVLGLAWAFTRAGVASLMVTLWSVSDAASAQAMAAFYRALASGQSKSAALRTVRRAMARGANPALRHPYFWAGYTLIGSPE